MGVIIFYSIFVKKMPPPWINTPGISNTSTNTHPCKNSYKILIEVCSLCYSWLTILPMFPVLSIDMSTVTGGICRNITQHIWHNGLHCFVGMCEGLLGCGIWVRVLWYSVGATNNPLDTFKQTVPAKYCTQGLKLSINFTTCKSWLPSFQFSF